jgi:hypothetical protein
MSRVRVAVRLRPNNNSSSCAVEIEQQECQLVIKKDDASQSYTYDNVFGPQCTQMDVFQQFVKPHLNINNLTIMAYGHTGAGKTYSMGFGGSEGIATKSLKYLFEEETASEGCKVTIQELYQNKFQELCKEENVHTFDQANNLLHSATENRTTSATNMNSRSSRSHMICRFTTKTKELTFVDLAGSECLKESSGTRQQEGIAINTGLFYLRCIISAHAKGTVQPYMYRASKLTTALQNALGGNGKTLFLACVCPTHDYLSIVSTLRYAHQAKKIKNKINIKHKTRNEDLNDNLLEMSRTIVSQYKETMLKTTKNTSVIDSKLQQLLQDNKENKKVNHQLLQDNNQIKQEIVLLREVLSRILNNEIKRYDTDTFEPIKIQEKEAESKVEVIDLTVKKTASDMKGYVSDDGFVVGSSYTTKESEAEAADESSEYEEETDEEESDEEELPANKKKQRNKTKWTQKQIDTLFKGYEKYGKRWVQILKEYPETFKHMNGDQLRCKYNRLIKKKVKNNRDSASVILKRDFNL